jgi:tetratricopeptide (TPR) repeat protein
MGKESFKKDENDNAVNAFDEAVNADTKDTFAWEEEAEAFWKSERYDEAIEAFDTFYELSSQDNYYDDPTVEEIFTEKGIYLAKDKGKYPEAIRCFDKAIGWNPDYAYALNNKGVVLVILDKYSDAISAFNEAIEYNFLEAWYNKGNVLSHQGKHKEAIDAYDQVIESDPDFFAAWNNKGISLLRLEKYDEAIIAFEKAIELDPNHCALRNYKLAVHRKREDSSMKLRDTAIEIKPRRLDAIYDKADLVMEPEYYIQYGGYFGHTIRIEAFEFKEKCDSGIDP